MALEDKHLDVLQNIEFGITQIYREDPSMRDVDAIKALGALIRFYTQKNMGKTPEIPELDGLSAEVFNAVTDILKLREGPKKEEEAPSKPRFSRALREPTQNEIILACLRKIEKSAKRWNKRDGERGYLDFINNFVQ